MRHDGEKLFRSGIVCQVGDCKREAWQVRQAEDKSLKAYCWGCWRNQGEPKHEGELAMLETCLAIQPDLITKVVFHKLSDAYDRRGDVAVFYVKEIENLEWAVRAAIEIAQLVLMMAGHHYTITSWGARGEQNNAWIEPCTWREPGPSVAIRHKYLGEKEIKTIQALIKVLAWRFKWEVEDGERSLLELMVSEPEKVYELEDPPTAVEDNSA